MDRTQKKCFLASVGVHSLLFLLLLVGPAFLSTQVPPDNSPILDFVAYKTVDQLVSGGGNPNARPSAPVAEIPKIVPPQPVVQPEPKKPEPKPEPRKPEPEPVKEAARKPLINPDSLEPIEKKPRLPDVSTTLVKRKDSQAENNKRKAEQAAKAEAKRQADARKRIAETISEVAENLSSGLSSGTTIELKGPGGGGIPYANFLEAVKTRYARAWQVPDGVTDDQATTTATVTIARNGTVVNARIITYSRNAEVDRSVQLTLERVKWAAPLPDDAKEDQREVTIHFNVKARRSIG
jgi:TonB family protein